MTLMRAIAVVLIWLDATALSASAQSGTTTLDSSSRPTTGGSPGIRPPADATPSFEASGGTEILRHRDFAGKPCLAVTGAAHAHIVNPNLYDHVITTTNNCPQRIAMQVCYYQTRDCISVEIPGGEQKQAILGTMPSGKDFRFEFREKF